MALDHVNVVVSDMARSIAFYTRLLDLEVIMDRRLEGPWYEALSGRPGATTRCVILDRREGGSRIELLEASSPGCAAPAGAPGLGHFALRVNDLDRRLDEYAALTGRRVAPVSVPETIVRGGKRMAYLTDPDGALLELAEYGLTRPEFLSD